MSKPIGAVLPRELKDAKTGVTVKTSARLSVGHASENRLVVISFDDLEIVVAISPASARQLADELRAEADTLSQ
jgi:hypothetical protein